MHKILNCKILILVPPSAAPMPRPPHHGHYLVAILASVWPQWAFFISSEFTIASSRVAHWC